MITTDYMNNNDGNTNNNDNNDNGNNNDINNNIVISVSAHPLLTWVR